MDMPWIFFAIVGITPAVCAPLANNAFKTPYQK
jgi:hypothetical protein